MFNKTAASESKYGFLSRYFRQYARYAIAGMLLMTAVSMGRIAQPLILREIVDKAVPAGDQSLLLRQALFYLALVLSVGALTYWGTMIMSKLGLSVVTRIKEDLFAHLLTLPVSYFDTHAVGELMARTENDVEKVRDLFSSLGVSFAVSILMIAGTFAVTATIAPALAGIMALIVGFFLVVLLAFFRKIIGRYEASRGLYAKIVSRVTEFVQGMDILRAFDRTAWARKSLDKAGVQKRDTDAKLSLIEYSAMSVIDSLAGPLFIVALVLMYAPRVLDGAMTLGTFLLFVEYGASLLRPVVEIAESVRRIQQAKVSLLRIGALFDLAPEPMRPGGSRPAFDKDVTFEHIWHAYKDEDWVLRDVSFTVRRGTMTALVGPSGSGKSTTVQLLCGFYAPQKGRVLVDGENLDAMDMESWRKKLGLVLQDVFLFPGSVMENVRLWDASIPEAEAARAIENVQASAVLRKLPGGISENLWERGGNLSSGERQLLAFARAMAANPEFVILDEATSSIDMETEEKIRRSLDTLLRGRTSLVVAHRLSSIVHADQILYFKEGRIIARGTHEELMESNADYRLLVERQYLSGERA